MKHWWRCRVGKGRKMPLNSTFDKLHLHLPSSWVANTSLCLGSLDFRSGFPPSTFFPPALDPTPVLSCCHFLPGCRHTAVAADGVSPGQCFCSAEGRQLLWNWVIQLPQLLARVSSAQLAACAQHPQHPAHPDKQALQQQEYILPPRN